MKTGTRLEGASILRYVLVDAAEAFLCDLLTRSLLILPSTGRRSGAEEPTQSSGPGSGQLLILGIATAGSSP